MKLILKIYESTKICTESKYNQISFKYKIPYLLLSLDAARTCKTLDGGDFKYYMTNNN